MNDITKHLPGQVSFAGILKYQKGLIPKNQANLPFEM